MKLPVYAAWSSRNLFVARAVCVRCTCAVCEMPAYEPPMCGVCLKAAPDERDMFVARAVCMRGCCTSGVCERAVSGYEPICGVWERARGLCARAARVRGLQDCLAHKEPSPTQVLTIVSKHSVLKPKPYHLSHQPFTLTPEPETLIPTP